MSNLPSSAPAETDFTWVVEPVDRLFYVGPGTERSLVIDRDGRPHEFCGGGCLYHGWEDDGGWQWEIVDRSPEVGAYAAAAVDGQGAFHVSYRDGATGALRYAGNTRGSWDIEIVDAGPDAGHFTSIALGPDGTPVIGYVEFRGWGDSSVMCAVRTGSGWMIEPVCACSYFPHDTCLGVDSAGGIHMVFPGASGSGCRLYYAQGVLGSWDVRVLPMAFNGRTRDEASVALDGQDCVHFAWSESTPNQGVSLLYTKGFPRGPEEIEIVDNEGDVGRQPSLALDSAGYPHIAYRFYIPRIYGDPRYAWKDNAGWHIETVDPVGGVPRYPALALTADDRPYVSYLEEAGDALRIAERDHLGWSATTIGLSAYSGWDSHQAEFIAIATGPSGEVGLGYCTSRGLLYAAYDGETWCREVADTSLPESVSLAIDRNRTPHMCHLSADSTVRYAVREGESWFAERVGEDAAQGAPSLAVDSLGRPHMAYLMWGKRGLCHACRTTAGWCVSTVSTNVSSEAVALAVDGLDVPHLVYAERDPGGTYLAHAQPEGVGWSVEFIDAGDKNYFSSRAVDVGEDGVVHVCYVGSYEDVAVPKYARRECGIWSIETADLPAVWSKWNAATVVDRTGRVWYGYSVYEDGGSIPAYAVRDIDGWQIREASGLPKSDRCPSFDLDSEDRPHFGLIESQAILHAGPMDDVAPAGRITDLRRSGPHFFELTVELWPDNARLLAASRPGSVAWRVTSWSALSGNVIRFQEPFPGPARVYRLWSRP